MSGLMRRFKGFGGLVGVVVFFSFGWEGGWYRVG